MNAPFSFSKNTYQLTNDILSHLQKVKRVGDGRYIALCPCHNDTKPSLNITIKPDGLTLIHCFPCGANGLNVCEVLGINPTALFPPTDNPSYDKQPRSGFSAWQLLHSLEADLVRLLIIANELKTNHVLSGSDRDFIAGLILRINDGLQYLEGRK
jgi:hypothetical protein